MWPTEAALSPKQILKGCSDQHFRCTWNSANVAGHEGSMLNQETSQWQRWIITLHYTPFIFNRSRSRGKSNNKGRHLYAGPCLVEPPDVHTPYCRTTWQALLSKIHHWQSLTVDKRFGSWYCYEWHSGSTGLFQIACVLQPTTGWVPVA